MPNAPLNKEKPKNRRKVLLRMAKYFFRYKFTIIVVVFLMLSSNLLALLGPLLSGMAIYRAAWIFRRYSNIVC